MDILIDQFDSANATHRKMEEAQRAANESFNSLVNATAAANGAGLIAIAGYLPGQTSNAWLLISVSVAGLAFTTGLCLAGAAKIALNHKLLVVANGYRVKLQKHNFEQHFAPHLSDEDRQMFATGFTHNANAGLLLQHDSEAKRDRWASRSLVAFVVAFTVFASSVIVQKATDLPAARENARCRALELDMMKARPLRVNSQELFQSLNCKPQTDAPLQFAQPAPAGE